MKPEGVAREVRFKYDTVESFEITSMESRIYEETRGVFKIFLEKIVCDVVTYTKLARRKIAAAMDVIHALKMQGKTPLENGCVTPL
ncbi:Histone H [Trema orientale]|uniref:Histone H4 n=1 Tax=Trema orientale TaxID=63057 RepID=A0A2P5EC70_TREOI|nr:Histone H [Trema orientale]